MKRSHVTWFLGAYLLLRWILATLPGYVVDVQAYKRWTLYAARLGIAQVYDASDFDYPPLYAYFLYPLGRLYGLISPEALEAHADTTILTILIKLPPLLADFGIAALLYYTARWVAGSRSVWRFAAPALYLLNPAVLFDTAYWGQPDSVHSFFVLAAFVLILHAAPGTPPFRPSVWGPWALLTLGALMKPLAAPFFPLLAVLIWARHGIRACVVGALGMALTALLVFTPFLLAGEGTRTWQRVTGDVRLMAHTSSNGHNLWWLLGGWRDANAPMLGPLTATHIGLILFGILYLAVLWRGHTWQRTPQGLTLKRVLGLALLVGYGFFMLSTHMHENHSFQTVPLALAILVAASASRGVREALLRSPPGWLFLGATSCTLLNLLMHDLVIVTWPPFSWGGPSENMNLHLKRPFLKGEEVGIWISLLLNLSFFTWMIASAFRPSGWLGAVETSHSDTDPSTLGRAGKLLKDSAGA